MNTLTLPLLVFLVTLSFWLLPSTWFEGAMRQAGKIKRHLQPRSHAAALISELLLLEGQEQLRNFTATQKLPEYKFFTALVASLLDSARRLGASISPALKELRQGIGRDEARERQVGAIKKGALAQFAIVSLITWLFMLMAALMAEIPLSWAVLTTIVCLQGVGALIFLKAERRLRQHYFAHLNRFLQVQYSFKALGTTNLSAQVIVKRTGIDELFHASFKGELLFLQRRLKLLIWRWKEQGGAIKSEWDDALSESWSLHELFFSRYQKTLEGVKFAVLALFFLSSYFIFVGSLFVGFFGTP